MSKRGDMELLSDILEAIKRIDSYLADLTYKRFVHDTKTQDAIIRNLEVIGEAAKNLSATLKARHKEVPWKDLAQVRDKLIHHYFGVNLEIIWGIVDQELDPVTKGLKKILKELK